MIDQEVFYRHLESGNQTIDFLLLKTAISALVAQVIIKIPEWEIDSAFLLSLSLIKFLRTNIVHILEKSSLFGVQTCLLLSLCGFASVESTNPTNYTGTSTISVIDI